MQACCILISISVKHTVAHCSYSWEGSSADVFMWVRQGELQGFQHRVNLPTFTLKPNRPSSSGVIRSSSSSASMSSFWEKKNKEDWHVKITQLSPLNTSICLYFITAAYLFRIKNQYCIVHVLGQLLIGIAMQRQ